MLTAAHRKAWIAEHGPWLYWNITKPRLWPWVLRDGIQPQDATKQTGLHPNMPPRPGHVYFLTDWTPRARYLAGVTGEPQVRMDIRTLNLDRFASDEDRLGAHKIPPRGSPEEEDLPGWGQFSVRTPDLTVGEWMNRNTAIVDQPEWVAFSIERLTVAYRGPVAPDLLQLLPLHLLDDWEPASPGEPYVQLPRGARAAHFIGQPQQHPT